MIQADQRRERAKDEKRDRFHGTGVLSGILCCAVSTDTQPHDRSNANPINYGRTGIFANPCPIDNPGTYAVGWSISVRQRINGTV
jgi:hypothetical protein